MLLMNIWPVLLRDFLFRVGLYRGIAVPSVPDLIVCLLYRENSMSRVFETYLNVDHELAPWLLEECGPWTIRMKRPFNYRQTYLAFARVADAVTFRLLSA